MGCSLAEAPGKPIAFLKLSKWPAESPVYWMSKKPWFHIFFNKYSSKIDWEEFAMNTIVIGCDDAAFSMKHCWRRWMLSGEWPYGLSYHCWKSLRKHSGKQRRKKGNFNLRHRPGYVYDRKQIQRDPGRSLPWSFFGPAFYFKQRRQYPMLRCQGDRARIGEKHRQNLAAAPFYRRKFHP